MDVGRMTKSIDCTLGESIGRNSSLPEKTPLDSQLLGLWLVKSIEMEPEKAVALIGGLPDELVEFTDQGEYVIWGEPTDPHKRVSRCRCHPTNPPGLDVWIPGLEPLTAQCIYKVDGNELVICIAGNAGKRPSEIRRDDQKPWCLVQLERWTGPRPKKVRRKRKPLLEPGKFIPEGFLDL